MYPTGEGTDQRVGQEGRVHRRSLHQRSRAAERGIASVERLVGRLASLPLLPRDYERVLLDRSRRFVDVFCFSCVCVLCFFKIKFGTLIYHGLFGYALNKKVGSVLGLVGLICWNIFQQVVCCCCCCWFSTNSEHKFGRFTRFFPHQNRPFAFLLCWYMCICVSLQNRNSCSRPLCLIQADVTFILFLSGDIYLHQSCVFFCRSYYPGAAIAPYFYTVFLVLLLVDRAFRDDTRCRAKYGKHWDKVRARMLARSLAHSAKSTLVRLLCLCVVTPTALGPDGTERGERERPAGWRSHFL